MMMIMMMMLLLLLMMMMLLLLLMMMMMTLCVQEHRLHCDSLPSGVAPDAHPGQWQLSS
jgi:hypothetical protein